MSRTCMHYVVFLGALVIPAILCLPGPASAQLSLDWYTVDGGGQSFSTGGTFSLGGTAGQPDAGRHEGGAYVLCGGFWFGGGSVSGLPEESPEEGAPLAFRAAAGFPNPFHDRTSVQLDLPEACQVRIMVFDPSGRVVRTLQSGPLGAGRHALAWDGDRDSGQRAPAGVYLLLIRAGRHESHHRLVLLQ